MMGTHPVFKRKDALIHLILRYYWAYVDRKVVVVLDNVDSVQHTLIVPPSVSSAGDELKLCPYLLKDIECEGLLIDTYPTWMDLLGVPILNIDDLIVCRLKD